MFVGARGIHSFTLVESRCGLRDLMSSRLVESPSKITLRLANVIMAAASFTAPRSTGALVGWRVETAAASESRVSSAVKVDLSEPGQVTMAT